MPRDCTGQRLVAWDGQSRVSVRKHPIHTSHESMVKHAKKNAKASVATVDSLVARLANKLTINKKKRHQRPRMRRTSAPRDNPLAITPFNLAVRDVRAEGSVASFIRGLYQEHLLHALLPSDWQGLYAVTHRHTTYVPAAGASGGQLAAACACLINPYLVPFDSFNWNFVRSGAIATWPSGFYMSPIMQNSASTAGICFGDLTLAGKTAPATSYRDVPLTQRYYGTSSNTYGATIRWLGVRVRIQYTGSVQNEGGTLYIHHGGGQNHALLNMAVDQTALAGSFATGITSFGDLMQSRSRVTVARIGDSAEFIFRPSTYEFQTVTSFHDADQYAAPIGYTQPQSVQIDDYLPQALEDGAPTLLGWNLGFWIQYNGGLISGANMPYLVTIDVLTHENVFQQQATGSSTMGTPINTGEVKTYRHAGVSDAIHNHTAAVHQARSYNSVSTQLRQPLKLAEGMARDSLVQAGSDVMTDAIGAVFKGGKMKRL